MVCTIYNTVHASAKYYQLFIMKAVRDGLSKMVDVWIEYVSPEGEDGRNKLNERDEHGMAPVHYAAKFNRLDNLRKLYTSGAGKSLSSPPSLSPYLPPSLTHSLSLSLSL